MTGRLHPADVEAIARRVAELVGGPSPRDAGSLLTAAQVAERFGVRRRWVYDHADRLGALRLTDGDKARLRFDPATVAAALTARQEHARSIEPSPPPRRRRRSPAAPTTPGGCPLLPIHDGSS